MHLTENSLVASIEAAEQALDGEHGEKKIFVPTKKRCFFWGYLNASRGSMCYSSNFFLRSGSFFDGFSAQNKTYRAAFLAGVRSYICNSVQFNAGISDAFSLLCNDSISESAYRDDAWHAFVKGFERGFDKIFYPEDLNQISVYAFLLAAGEQARRKDSITSPIPPHIAWPDQSPERYQRVFTAINEIFPPCDQPALLFKFLESFPRTKNTEEYQRLIDIDRVLSLIHFSETLGELDFISQTLPNFFNHRNSLPATKLVEKSQYLCSKFFNEQDGGNCDNYGYCIASRIEHRTSGLVRETLNQYQEKYDATSVEVSIKESIYRVFLVFNSITGPCVIHCGLDDIKCGIPIKTLRTQAEIPNYILPKKKIFSYDFTENDSPEKIESAQMMMEEITALKAKERCGIYQCLKNNLPAFQRAAERIGRSLE